MGRDVEDDIISDVYIGDQTAPDTNMNISEARNDLDQQRL
jgi:hypothetical protein